MCDDGGDWEGGVVRKTEEKMIEFVPQRVEKCSIVDLPQTH